MVLENKVRLCAGTQMYPMYDRFRLFKTDIPNTAIVLRRISCKMNLIVSK